MFGRQVFALLLKDMRTEWRTREIFTSMFVFAVLVVVVFNFAIGSNPDVMRQVAPGILWVALLFSTVLGLQRSVQMEVEEDCMQGLLLAMGDRSVLFVAKTVANMVYLLVVAAFTLPLFSIWFRLDIWASLAGIGVILLLGMLGFSAVGTFFSMLAVNARARDAMLPLLFLPVSVPLTIGSVYATADLIEGKTLADIADWLTLIGIFDIVFVVLGLLVFDYIVEE